MQTMQRLCPVVALWGVFYGRVLQLPVYCLFRDRHIIHQTDKVTVLYSCGGRPLARSADSSRHDIGSLFACRPVCVLWSSRAWARNQRNQHIYILYPRHFCPSATVSDGVPPTSLGSLSLGITTLFKGQIPFYYRYALFNSLHVVLRSI